MKSVNTNLVVLERSDTGRVEFCYVPFVLLFSLLAEPTHALGTPGFSKLATESLNAKVSTDVDPARSLLGLVQHRVHLL